MKKLHNKQHLVSWQNTKKKESCHFVLNNSLKTSVKKKKIFLRKSYRYILYTVHGVFDSCIWATNPTDVLV